MVRKNAIGVVSKSPDLECHVRLIEIEGTQFVEMRDYVISLEEYGRGYWVPYTKSSLKELGKVFNDLAKDAP